MQKEDVTVRFLQKKSEELEMTFSTYLWGIVQEEAFKRICESDYADNLLLRSTKVIGAEYYRKRIGMRLEYDYVLPPEKREEKKADSVYLEELAESLGGLFSETPSDSFVTFYVKKRTLKYCMELDLTGCVENIQIPVNIRLYLLKGDAPAPKKESFSLMMYPKHQIISYSVPTEYILEKNFLKIFNDSEKIKDMQPYYNIYYQLSKESVDGRKIEEYLEEKTKELNSEEKKRRFEEIKSGGKDVLQEEIWKMFLRGKKEKAPDWKTVFDSFLNFFEPIWNAIIEGTVFFGDWMPELKRFL